MSKLYDRLCAAEAVLAGTLLVLMVALIFLGGVSRVLGYPLNWSTDFATAFFAWACFLCADIASTPPQPIVDTLGPAGVARIRTLVTAKAPAHMVRDAKRCLVGPKP